MADMMRELIQYVGLSDSIPDSATIFKQLNVEKTFTIPEAKPFIEQIVKAICELKIKNTKVIKTPKGTSLEGQKLTGWKLIIEGVVNIKIQYVADEPEQSVHAAHFLIPISTFVILPENFIMGTAMNVQGYIEDIYVRMMDKDSIFNNITILLTADFC